MTQITRLKITTVEFSFVEKLLKTNLQIILLTVVLLGGGLNAAAQGEADTSQEKNSANKADQNLKSVARINPSTLAMEMSVPLTSYPGRNGNSLPVGFSYSSKVWRMDSQVTYFYLTPIGGYRQYVTQLRPSYSERSAAGWTSSVTFPVIEEKLDIFDQHGNPFSFEIDDGWLNTLWENSLEGISNPLNNPNQASNNCSRCWWIGADNICYIWVFDFGYCPGGSGGGGGGGGGSGGGGGGPEPPRMHYVKRVRVRMGDGSTNEFRKSDAVFGYCADTSPYNGPNCEGNGPDNYGTFISVDGSGMRLERNAQGSTLFLSDGSRYLFPATSTGGYDGANLYQATTFIEADGNVSGFSETTVNNQTVRKMTDTIGREAIDPLPKNFSLQEQQAGTQEVNLPGLNGQTQAYQIKWQNLKPRGCEASTDPNCQGTDGTVGGALENQSEKLFYFTRLMCNGSAYTDVGPANEILFPANGWGLRSCNPFNVVNVNGTNTPVAVRSNAVVLSEIELPNGKKYVFKYNQYGEISKITYPTGSYETFVYARIPPMNGFSELAYDQTNRGVVERRVYHANGALEQRWQYAATFSIEGYKITTIAPRADNPLANGITSERYLHVDITNGFDFGFSDPRAGMAREERVIDENGVLRSKTQTVWGTLPPRTGGDGLAMRDPHVLSETKYIFEGGSNALKQTTTFEYDADLNVKKVIEYPFEVVGSNTMGTLPPCPDCLPECPPECSPDPTPSPTPSITAARITETTFLVNDPNISQTTRDGYRARQMLRLPSESRAVNPANNEVIGKSRILYDEAAYPIIYAGAATGWQDPQTNFRGKATTTRTWVKETDTWLETHAQYDNFGNLRKAWDASGDANKFVETEYSSQYNYAYPTKVITPAPDPTNTTGTNETSFVETIYDLTTGLTVEVKDEFGQITKPEYNDVLLRPTKVFGLNFTAPITETIYDDTNLWVKVRGQIDESNWTEATTFMDGLGRTIKTQTKDSQGDVFVETEYDNLGRVKQTTNPYRLGEQKLWSKPRYDELGRAVESFAPAPDGQTGASLGITSFSISSVANYVGTVVTSTDASGRKSRSIANALGQLLRIDEATATGGTADADLGTLANPNQPTYYSYSPQGKMVKVQQGKAGETIQNRYFLYDALGRLIRVRQPEQQVNAALNLTDAITGNNQWTAGFSYDVLGNVLTATDAKGVTITNTYDNANRVKTRNYAGEPAGQTTPSVSYFYDGKGLASQQSPNYAKGKLTKVASSVSETRYTLFDNLGRLTQSQQITDGQTYTSSYLYNLSGALVQETYPSGRVVKNEFETDGDLSRIFGNAVNQTERTYANGFNYTADGKIQRLRLGNGRWESARFNERLQVTELALGSSNGDGGLWKLAYEYGELNTDGVTVNAAKNTGNIAKQTLSFNGLAQPFVQTYKYDSLYRLTEAKETNNNQQTWKQSFGYDRFGNRTSYQKFIGTTQIALDNKTFPQIDPTTNRFLANQGYTFDSGGNLVQDADGRSFTFNGENKQTEVRDVNNQVIGTYFYDGEGKRVKKVTNLETTIFVYSSGKLVAEYSTAAPPTNPTTNYTATDQLGSPRVITNAFGQVTSRRDFLPFGEELYPDTVYRKTGDKYGANDSVRQRFTGYQKDTETGLDFAEARMYENRHARFTAVDPLLASGKSADPQTFNRYVYVMNNPLVLTDPTGLQAGASADEVIAIINIIAYEWISRTYSYGGNSVTTRDQIPAAIKYYSYTRGGDLGLPDRGSQVTRQLDKYVNSTTMPSIQALNQTMETVRSGTGYVPALGSLMEAQMAGRDNNYTGFAFNMAMFGADIIPGGGTTRKAVQEGGERGFTTLFRAVSKAELDDIAEFGLRTKAGGYETTKLFATSLEDAAQFGRNNFKLDGIPNHIIQVEVPNSVMNTSNRFRADWMDAVAVPANQLPMIQDIRPVRFSPIKFFE